MKKIVIGNLKMNLLSIEERDKYIAWIKKEIVGKKLGNVDVVVCPPYVHLEAFKKSKGKILKIGAQNMFPEKQGSYTGEISPIMLKNFGCEYVILGHSERRRYQGEKGDEISLKVFSAIKHGLVPILCIGEKKEEREAGKSAEVISRQLVESLSRIRPSMLEKIIVAYEPAWSVGSDNVPTSNQIMESKLLIRKILFEVFGKKYSNKPRIIYGGSVSTKFVEQTCIEPEMDGALIGRESLLPNEFIKIAEIINNS
jgi:triosephosphate isomerase (TIM)